MNNGEKVTGVEGEMVATEFVAMACPPLKYLSMQFPASFIS
jgi:hypothetical protein